MTDHKSDCAVHNEPAMPAGPCDCGAGIVEAMARAAYENYMDGLIGCCELSWTGLPQDHRDRMIESQRAALTAALDCMQSPSDVMIIAGYEAKEEFGKADNRFELARMKILPRWQAMLSQLRKEALDE